MKKAAMVMAGLISYDAEAMKSFVVWRRKPQVREQVLGLTQYLDGYSISGCKDTKPVVFKCTSPDSLKK